MADAIFIAGYYRSGTSALAGALQRLGVVLHNDAEPNEHNPQGFYEIPELIEFDVGLFNHLGAEWTDVRGLAEGWWNRADLAAHLARLGEILRRRFGAETLWGLKHPHLCRLFPIYEQAAKQAGQRVHAIHIARDPWIVAASQHKKNNLSRAHAVLLWVDYLICAERHTRHLPRSWLTYQDMLSSPVAALRQVGLDLGLDFGSAAKPGWQEAAGSLTASLNRAQPVAAAGLFSPLHQLASRMWDALQDHDSTTTTWDSFAVARDELVAFLTEISDSGARILPGLHNGLTQALAPAAAAALRPAERLDDGAKARLIALRETAAWLPTLTVFIAAPPHRAHAIGETLASLREQWHQPTAVEIISCDEASIEGELTRTAPPEAGAISAMLCAAMNGATTDYAAMINAGDRLAADACLRFALAAARPPAASGQKLSAANSGAPLTAASGGTTLMAASGGATLMAASGGATLMAASGGPAMIYCDEVVPRDDGHWVRYKPGWDVTRLRQAAYIGDWVWYQTSALRQAGGFDEAFAGVEEYEMQLRLAETGLPVLRLAETLFTRAAHSRRDNIPSTQFGERALAAVAAHLARQNMAATVKPRQYMGLFAHERAEPDPGTAIILLCDGADVPMLDRWLKELLTGLPLSGPVILAGSDMPVETAEYLAAVCASTAKLEGKVLAVPPVPQLPPGEALRQALALWNGELVAVLEARSIAGQADWLASLRARLADPGVTMVAGRILVPRAADSSRFSVQGPIILGADTRLGAGHLSDDPGAGGWLVVDQEAQALSPTGLLARRAALAGCTFSHLSGDALWIDLCAQIRAQDQRIVWVPDVSFITAGNHIKPDYECRFREGSKPARALAWEDGYHHPALSLRGDLLAPELRHGLVRAAPADPRSLLLSGPAEEGMALLNAARALRGAGMLEASWVGEHMLAAELGRRTPAPWVRINPQAPPPAYAGPYHAVFCCPPEPAARGAIAAAARVFVTSPGLVSLVKTLSPPGQNIALWRPALSATVWRNMAEPKGLNTLPRILWIDEGHAPDWWAALVAATQNQFSWVIVEREGGQYQGGLARLRPPADELGWARELGALAPHIFVRPVAAAAPAVADHYKTLLAAACGCLLLIDERLDTPASLNAQMLPSTMAAWQQALQAATADLAGALSQGQATRRAALALATVEDECPGWVLPVAPAALPANSMRAAE